ncbi:hypothetical protein V8E55_008709 [Tylopilus felleus]
MWHIDGHHKLIRWGICIHANTNNRAYTVFNLFRAAIETYGTPSRVRRDCGGENIDVAVWMIQHYTGINFVRHWKAFFICLEDIHKLNVGNPHHLWLLHYLFLRQLNDDCQQFQHDWNHHPISKRGHNQSPLDMRFLSTVQHGVYVEPESPDVVGHSNNINLEAEIIAEQSSHVRHAAVNVSLTVSPFHTIQTFDDEWTGGLYPEIELISVGRSKQEYMVELPFEVWWTRSVLWVQGLDIMTRICMMENGEL